MSFIKDWPITSELFGKDIKSEDFQEMFEKIFETKIGDFLSEYEHDEIDEFPIDMEDRGIMISFSAETSKAPAQIEYIDLEVYNNPRNIGFLAKKIPVKIALKKPEDIEAHLIPFSNLRNYNALSDKKKIDRIIFQHEDLRYELALNKDSVIVRIRVCFAENESTVNMRTYYLFDNG